MQASFTPLLVPANFRMQATAGGPVIEEAAGLAASAAPDAGRKAALFPSRYMHIRPRRPAEHPALLALWERSVRATHTFLTEEDIGFYRSPTAEILAGGALELWVLANEADVPIGFLGLAGDAI